MNRLKHPAKFIGPTLGGIGALTGLTVGLLFLTGMLGADGERKDGAQMNIASTSISISYDHGLRIKLTSSTGKTQ